MVLEFNDANFEDEVLKSGQTVLVDVFATWCGPCQMMSPIIDEIAEETAGKVKVGKVDSDHNMAICQKYGIMSIPTILIIKNGEVVEKFVGVTSKDEILSKLN